MHERASQSLRRAIPQHQIDRSDTPHMMSAVKPATALADGCVQRGGGCRYRLSGKPG